MKSILLPWLVIALLLPGGAIARESTAPDLVKGIDVAPVVIDGIVLFEVRGISIYTASRRASEISGRIVSLARTTPFTTNQFVQVASEMGVDIRSAEARILTILPEDAELIGMTPALTANIFVDRIEEAIQRYQQERQPRELLFRGLRALLLTILLIVVLRILTRVHRRISEFVRARILTRIEKGVQFQSFEVVQRQHLWLVYRGIMDLIRIAVGAFVMYLYLQHVLTLFPWTRGAGLALLAMLVSPLRILATGLIGFLPNLIFLVLLFFFVRYLLRVVRLFFLNVENQSVRLTGFDPEWSLPTFRLVRVMIILFSAVIAYPYIPGSDSSAFKGISVFMGVILSLGSSSFIGNIIAGYSMTYRKAFRVGDRIRVGEHLGDVLEIRMLVTHLRSLKNEEIIIPNSEILSREIINYNRLAQTTGLILHTTVGIGYETPWRQVEAMLLEAAGKTEGVQPEPPPFVLQKGLGDFAVNYEINVYANDPSKMSRIYTNLHQNILDVFNTYGVQIMTPNYEGDPPDPKLVPPGQWFAAPAVKPPETDPLPPA